MSPFKSFRTTLLALPFLLPIIGGSRANESISPQQTVILQALTNSHQKSLGRSLFISLTGLQSADNVTLPPDPGEAGKRTLQGVDVDGDGIRDDVQRYIILNYYSDPNTMQALFQLAKIYQSIFSGHIENGTEIYIANKIGSAIECLYFVDENHAHDNFLKLRAKILNTKTRTKKYLLYDKNLSGKVFPSSRLPLDEHYKLCKFDLQ